MSPRSIVRRQKAAEDACLPYPPDWNPDNWMVPYQEDGRAVLHHDHSAQVDDHSTCGPVIFCCPKSAAAFQMRCPASVFAYWQATDAEQIISWLDAGVQAVYLVFCNASAPGELYIAGLSGQLARQALLRKKSVGEFLPSSRQLASVDPLIEDFQRLALTPTPE